jgi:hypothetical protein
VVKVVVAVLLAGSHGQGAHEGIDVAWVGDIGDRRCMARGVTLSAAIRRPAEVQMVADG